MNKLLLSIVFGSLFFSCSANRSTFSSVPVLLDYRLFYPDEALERGLEGKVVVSVLVTEDGWVDSVQLYKSSGHPLLDSAGVQTAKTFIFSPAVINNKPVRSLVTVPVEFVLRMVDFETWITQVRILQHKIEQYMSKECMDELYSLYKKLIFSTRSVQDLGVNDYVREAVLDSTAKLWAGYWSTYPAASLLFVDIINRYPEAFISLRAKVDLNKFLKEEVTRIRYTIPYPGSDSLINRLYTVVKN